MTKGEEYSMALSISDFFQRLPQDRFFAAIVPILLTCPRSRKSSRGSTIRICCACMI